MQSHGTTFNLESAKMCSPAIIETYISYYKDIRLAATDHIPGYVLLLNYAISIWSYTPNNTYYSFIIFSLLVIVVILFLNYLVLILYLYIHFLS